MGVKKGGEKWGLHIKDKFFGLQKCAALVTERMYQFPIIQ